MPRIALNADIHPVSDFRTNFSAFIDQVHDTRRPIVITQHGRSAAVLMDVSEYERLMDKIEMIQEIETGDRQIEAGLGIPHEQIRRRLKDRFRK